MPPTERREEERRGEKGREEERRGEKKTTCHPRRGERKRWMVLEDESVGGVLAVCGW